MKKFTRLTEENVWLWLALCCGVMAAVSFPWAPIRFGSLFLGVLAAGCAGEWLMVRHAHASRLCRVTAMLGRVLFALFLISFVWIQCIIVGGQRADPEADDARFVLVLGARIYNDRPSLTLAWRLDEAKRFLDEHPDAYAILCGGQGDNEPMPESHMMRDYLIDKGIAAERLLVEDKSTNTIENISNARAAFLDPLDVAPVTAVITSDFHLARARRLMLAEGLDPYGVPADTPYLAQRVVLYLREYCSTLGLILTGRYF